MYIPCKCCWCNWYKGTTGTDNVLENENQRVKRETVIRQGRNYENFEEYIKICGAEQPREASRIEYIGDIYAVKENEDLPDEYSSLLVYSHYSGSSCGIDTWYKLAPTGKKSKIVENPFSSCMKEKILLNLIQCFMTGCV